MDKKTTDIIFREIWPRLEYDSHTNARLAGDRHSDWSRARVCLHSRFSRYTSVPRRILERASSRVADKSLSFSIFIDIARRIFSTTMKKHKTKRKRDMIHDFL